MAPQRGSRQTSGNAKKQQQQQHPARGAPANRPQVVPAIPLPLMQKQNGKAPTKNSLPDTHTPKDLSVASLEAALIDTQVVQPSQRPAAPENVAQDAEADKAQAPQQHSRTLDATNNVDGVRERGNTNSHGNQPGVNGLVNTASSDNQPLEWKTGATQAAPQLSSADASNVNIGSNLRGDESHHAEAALPKEEQQYRRDTYQNQQPAPTSTSQPQSVMAQSQAEFPAPSPAHVPHAQHPRHGDRNHDMNTRNLPLHHAPHAHHQSNGNNSIMFGSFAGSFTPSPTHGAGGFIPPPPPGLPNGEARVNGHNAHSHANSFSMPANPQYMASIDGYGQIQVPAHAPQFETYPHGIGRYGPPTPHSFQGSNTSGEQAGGDNGGGPYPTPGPAYSGHAHHDRNMSQVHPMAPYPPYMSSPSFAQRPDVIEEELMSAIHYFRSQFNSQELADCVLEIDYSHGRHQPVVIHGHRLMLARSPALKQQIMLARSMDPGSHTVTMTADDPFLRADALWLALQRLYLQPLFHLPPPVMNGVNGIDFAGDQSDRFNFCLGYAAAGHFFDINDVFMRGIEIACGMINWSTIEDAMAFTVLRAVQRHNDFTLDQEGAYSHDVEVEYGYGPQTRILLDAMLSFIVNAFPHNFDVDISVSDPPRYARIPSVPITATTPDSSVNSPAIARGTSVRKPSNATRLSNIKFGDLPTALPEETPTPPREPAKFSQVLSRVLLNLHFDYLRLVLTSESNAISGWNTAQDRFHAVSQVIAEREARRLRAVEAVRRSLVPNATAIQLRLSAHRRHATAEQWDVLNWQEEVIQPRGTEGPRIVRRWVPQFDYTADTPRDGAIYSSESAESNFRASDSMV